MLTPTKEQGSGGLFGSQRSGAPVVLVLVYIIGLLTVVWFVEQQQQSKLTDAKAEMCRFVRTLSGTVDVSTYLLNAEQCLGLKPLLRSLLPIDDVNFRDENTTNKDFTLQQSGMFSGYVWGNLSYTGQLKFDVLGTLGLLPSKNKRSVNMPLVDCCTILNDCKGTLTVFA